MHKPLYSHLTPPCTVWRTPSGTSGFSPPGLLSRFLGRLRRWRARWRRSVSSRQVPRIQTR